MTSQQTTTHSTGRTVLITGGAGGIGSALVSRFLDNGDTVIATDVADDALDKLVKAHPDADQLQTLAVDITDADSVPRLADAAEAAGGLDVLINCAGWFPFTPFADTDPELWQKVMDVNIKGPYLVTHAVLPQMLGRGWGRIINFGSGSVFPGVAGQVHYVTAKASTVGFTRSLARAYGKEGITVNLVTPGVTLTGPVIEHFDEDLKARQRKNRALQRDQMPDDLVGPVFFLASPDSDFVTGQTLNVDGGMHMV